MIRHTRLDLSLSTALSIFALPIAMIEPSLRTQLMAAIGASPLLPPSLLATGQAAIALPTVAAHAYGKPLSALGKSTDVGYQHNYATIDDPTHRPVLCLKRSRLPPRDR